MPFYHATSEVVTSPYDTSVNITVDRFIYLSFSSDFMRYSLFVLFVFVACSVLCSAEKKQECSWSFWNLFGWNCMEIDADDDSDAAGPVIDVNQNPVKLDDQTVENINSALGNDAVKQGLVRIALSKMTESQQLEFGELFKIVKNLPAKFPERLVRYLEMIVGDDRSFDTLFANNEKKSPVLKLFDQVLTFEESIAPPIHKQTCREMFRKGDNAIITDELKDFMSQPAAKNSYMTDFVSDFASKVPFEAQNEFITLFNQAVNHAVLNKASKNVVSELDALIAPGYCVLQREASFTPANGVSTIPQSTDPSITRMKEHILANLIISGFDISQIEPDIDRLSPVVLMALALKKLNCGISAELVQVAMSKMDESERTEFQKRLSDEVAAQNEQDLPAIGIKLVHVLEKIVYDPERRPVSQIFEDSAVKDSGSLSAGENYSNLSAVGKLIEHAIHPNWGFKSARTK